MNNQTIKSKESILDEFYELKLTNKHRKNMYIFLLASVLSFYLIDDGNLRASIILALIPIFLGLFVTNRIFRKCKFYFYKTNNLKLPNTEPINCQDLCYYYYFSETYIIYNLLLSFVLIMFNFSIFGLLLLAIISGTVEAYIGVQFAYYGGFLFLSLTFLIAIFATMKKKKEILNNCKNLFFLENKKDVIIYRIKEKK